MEPLSRGLRNTHMSLERQDSPRYLYPSKEYPFRSQNTDHAKPKLCLAWCQTALAMFISI